MKPEPPDSKDPHHRWEPASVEAYSGYREGETPRAVVLCGVRFQVAEIISRERVSDAVSGVTIEIFECRLEAGWPLSLKRSADGSWWIRKNVLVPRFDVN